jgi:hypothetical protein
MVDAFPSQVQTDSSTPSSAVHPLVAASCISSSITREQLDAAQRVLEAEIEKAKAQHSSQDKEQGD